MTNHWQSVCHLGRISGTLCYEIICNVPQHRQTPPLQSSAHCVPTVPPELGLSCLGAWTWPASARGPPFRNEVVSISVGQGGRWAWPQKQGQCPGKALFFAGRSLPRGIAEPLCWPLPLQQRNKTAAIFRFMSNSSSAPGVGSPPRECAGL